MEFYASECGCSCEENAFNALNDTGGHPAQDADLAIAAHFDGIKIREPRGHSRSSSNLKFTGLTQNLGQL
jgi:hypothetical protein